MSTNLSLYLQYYMCYKEAFLLGTAFGIIICILGLRNLKNAVTLEP